MHKGKAVYILMKYLVSFQMVDWMGLETLLPKTMARKEIDRSSVSVAFALSDSTV